jgi:hypothetical protein
MKSGDSVLKLMVWSMVKRCSSEMEMWVIERDQANRLLIDCFCGKRIHIPRSSCCLWVAERRL